MRDTPHLASTAIIELCEPTHTCVHLSLAHIQIICAYSDVAKLFNGISASIFQACCKTKSGMSIEYYTNTIRNYWQIIVIGHPVSGLYGTVRTVMFHHQQWNEEWVEECSSCSSTSRRICHSTRESEGKVPSESFSLHSGQKDEKNN